MQEAITLLIVAVCAVLVVRGVVRRLRRKDCGCGEGKDCCEDSCCQGCTLRDNCKKKGN